MPMKITRLIIYLSFFFGSIFLQADDRTEFNICRLGENVRSVRLVRAENSKCLTVYSKGGKDQIVAESTNEQDCISAKDNILSNLRDGNFTCEIASQVSFTFIAPEKESTTESSQ